LDFHIVRRGGLGNQLQNGLISQAASPKFRHSSRGHQQAHFVTEHFRVRQVPLRCSDPQSRIAAEDQCSGK
jgi:hypothetical protein